MTYSSTDELPYIVKDKLPEHGQKIFMEAYNHAWEEYEDPEKRRGKESREEVSMKVAWSAVHSKYKKNSQGDWVEK